MAMAKSLSEGYKVLFKGKFQELVQELTEDGLKDSEVSDGIMHLQQVSENLQF